MNGKIKMILTGPEIIKEYKKGNLTIEPFDQTLVNPNSYNYRLGEQLQVFCGVKDNKQLFEIITILDLKKFYLPRRIQDTNNVHK